MANTSTYTVEGMTCDHCANAVRAEVSAIEGVTAVDVDLANGQVRVDSEAALDLEIVRHAIDEAGYTLVA